MNPVFNCWSSYGWSRGNYDIHDSRQPDDIGPPANSYGYTHSDGTFGTAFDGGLKGDSPAAISAANGPNTTNWLPPKQLKIHLKQITVGTPSTPPTGQ